jgi:hypothetical protein
MITPADCLKKYGNPVLLSTQSKHFELWMVPENIQKAFAHVRFSAAGTVGFPKKIFLNKDLKAALEKGLNNLIVRGHSKEMKTWDGCFIIRNQRGSATKMSLHSWAVAFDVNLEENQLGMVPNLSAEFVKCFTDAEFDWGGLFKRKDGMHFQLAKI